MRRTSHDMQVNVAGLRRNLKNLAHNYSDAQKKVREATSNDPWGPSSTLMAEIADLTYNVVAFTEIMQMVWKRLNDHGRNWRHVYKALVLLEYLIKTGSEKVGQQCKENIFAIKTLKDFQHLEEGRDQGQNVREKAKQLVNLLKDDERLRSERARALKAKERFAQSASGFGSDGGLDTPSSPRYPAFRGEWSSRDSADLPREIEVARPQTAGEEELQLQLALAMSREEAEQEEQKRRSDDVRLQLALSQSQQDFKQNQDKPSSDVLDLLDVSLGAEQQPVDPWGMMTKPNNATSSPWQSGAVSSPSQRGQAIIDPWQPNGANAIAIAGVAPVQKPVDPWNPSQPLPETAIRSNPWSPASQGSSTDFDDFDAITNRNRTTEEVKSNGGNNGSSDPFELNLLGDALPQSGPSPSTGATKKTPHSFLGENSALVNLDNLVTSKPSSSSATANPFSESQSPARSGAMFNTGPPKPSMNQIKQTAFMPGREFSTSPTPQSAFGGSNASFGGAPNGQFGSSPSQFLSNNGGRFSAPLHPVQDPWAPVTSNSNSQSPWTKATDTANPFLS